MNTDRAHLVKEIFQHAAELSDPERDAYLRERCGDDESLRSDVEQLLGFDARLSPRFLAGDSPASGDEKLPARIGHFQIVRRIAEGGMGAVFEGRQDHPRRSVALKVIRVAMASESLRRRFEYEVQILGQLKHPGIAQIYEAGTYNDGTGPVPYFAMEYVQGRTLIDFANHHQLKTRERLSLLAEVCDAVQHAHQKGVIHRDLKPANILVETMDGAHQPKILDFGVARATNSDIHEATMHTEPGQMVGTLSYMSPEQVEGRTDELDVRSDVYSLGVILYELLADRLPYDLRGRSLPDAGTIIRQHEPSRLRTIHPKLAEDIETIVGKALEKEKERRYSSASQLADDIRRFLADEPIVARPPSRTYQIRKFARRNKALVGGVAAVFLTLVLGIIGIAIALVQATHAERVAREHAEESRRLAAKATAISDFLTEMLSSVDPAKALGRELTILDALETAAGRIDSGFLRDQPELESELQSTIGRTYLAIGRAPEAEKYLRAALETRKRIHPYPHADIAASQAILSDALVHQGRSGEAEALLRESVAALETLHGPGNTDVASAVQSLGAALRAQEKYPEAQAMYQKSLDIRRQLLGQDHPDVAQSLNSLGLLRQNQGDFAGAEAYLREALVIRRKALGDPHPVVADGLNNLANLLNLLGKDVEAESLLEEALEMRRKVLGRDHPQVAQSINNLAVFLYNKGQFSRAEPLFREALALWRKTLPPGHADIGNGAIGLGLTLIALENHAEAETFLREALTIRSSSFPEGHPARLTVMSALGDALAGQGMFTDAESLLVSSYSGLKDNPKVPPKSQRTALERVVRLYERWNRPELAAKWRAELPD